MKRGTAVWGVGATLLAAAALAGCHAQNVEGAEGQDMEATIQNEAVTDMDVSPPFVEREFWLAMAEEPGWHLSEARQRFLDGDSQGAAEDLIKVAAMLKFETRHAYSSFEREKLLESVDDLRELARQLKFEGVPYEGVPDVEPLDQVAARTFEALAAHHVALADESLQAGDALMAGRYLQESANDIEKGFARADVDAGGTVKQDVAEARTLASQLVKKGNGDRAEVQKAVDRLRDADHGLAEVLGGRRK